MTDKTVFIDTSAFYALMDRSDLYHEPAAMVWKYLVETEIHIATSNYIIVESAALLQARLGFEAASVWKKDVLFVADTIWIDKEIQNLSFELWMGLGRRKISLVDCSSFIIMRNNDMDHVFGFDPHFEEQGFIPFTLQS